ncbi:MAG: hypothetical protein IJO16_06580 [Clostridia bacterium]|nr:hypothetical protein [Clostridia bacterium]
MKKVLAITLTMAMLFTMTAMAENISSSSGTASVDVKGSYVQGVASDTIYSVDIIWGDMNFTYTDAAQGTWNPATHDYDDVGEKGTWSASGNTITVTNHSNAGITASMEFKTDITTITHEFDNATFELDSAVGTSYNDAPNKTSTLTLDGTMEETDPVDGKIGTVTVVISGSSVNNSPSVENGSTMDFQIDKMYTTSNLDLSNGLLINITGENLNNISDETFDDFLEITVYDITAEKTKKLPVSTNQQATYISLSDTEATINYSENYFSSITGGVVSIEGDVSNLSYYILGSELSGVIEIM